MAQKGRILLLWKQSKTCRNYGSIIHCSNTGKNYNLNIYYLIFPINQDFNKFTVENYTYNFLFQTTFIHLGSIFISLEFAFKISIRKDGKEKLERSITC